MALVTQRDPQVIGAGLARWAAATRGLRGSRVVAASHPSVGYSSETVMVELADATETVHKLVVRLAPPTAGAHRDYDLTQQVVAQRAAAAAGVPIATPELVADTEWLGAPFVVMPRVHGHVLSEVAALDPWLLALSEPERAQVHETFVHAIATTHRADLALAAGVPARDNRAELDYWAGYLDWSSGGSPVRALVDALAWCRSRQPEAEAEPVLLWGDVRFGNTIFGDDLRLRAVLDWDMASIGAPEHDLAWFTTLETTMRTLLDTRLDGFPDRAGTIAQYESRSGRTVRDFEWYEVLALTRSIAIMTRISYMHRDAGKRPPMPIDDNPMLDLLAARIAAE
jgi:aminoglycoside phosphotransferase (APT) family kinase protein